MSRDDAIPPLFLEILSANAVERLFMQRPRLTSSRRIYETVEPSKPAATQTGDPKSTVDERPTNVLRALLSLPTPFLTQGELFGITQISSGSLQSKITGRLKAAGFIVVHKLQIKKTHYSIWEPTPLAYRALAISPPHLPSKGGYLHKFIASRVGSNLKNLGYEVHTEYRLSTGKAVDIAAFKGKVLIFLEIAVSPPLSKEVSNVTMDIDSPLKPARILVLALNGHAKRKLEALIAQERTLESSRSLITVILAGDVIKDPNVLGA